MSGLSILYRAGIQLITNNVLPPTQFFLDIVFQEVSPSNKLLIQPNPNVALDSMNHFTSAAMASIAHKILDGLMEVRFDNNSVFGSINFFGTANSTYQTSFTGVLASIV